MTLFALGLVLASGSLHAARNPLAKRASGVAGRPAFVWLYSALSTVILARRRRNRGERVGPLVCFMPGPGILPVGYFLSLRKGHGAGTSRSSIPRRERSASLSARSPAGFCWPRAARVVVWPSTSAWGPWPSAGASPVRYALGEMALMREEGALKGTVAAVSRSAKHTFDKTSEGSIRLLAGLGVEGDAHMGETVKHRSRVRQDPTKPNLRQVHLIHAELHDELNASGFAVSPGRMGENVTTRGVDLLSLPTGARLRLGEDALVEVTGLRNPCKQLDDFRPGLMRAVLGRDEDGNLVRKAGIMAVVLAGGEVRPGDPIRVELPTGPHRPLQKI